MYNHVPYLIVILANMALQSSRATFELILRMLGGAALRELQLLPLPTQRHGL